MIERDGDTVRLVHNPRAVATTSVVIIVFGVAAIGLGVLAAVSHLLGASAYIEILAVVFIGVGVVPVVATLRAGLDRELLELDTTTLRLRKGDQVLQSVSRGPIASLANFVSAGQGGAKTSVLLTAYDNHGDILAQWPMATAWPKKQFDEFLDATGIPDGLRH